VKLRWFPVTKTDTTASRKYDSVTSPTSEADPMAACRTACTHNRCARRAQEANGNDSA
jgi:hypothetical protein